MSTSAGSPTAVGGAREQVARLLTLVPLLHRSDGVRLGEAADLLGISTAQLLKDLKVLFLCGLPGGLPDDLIDVDLDALENADGGPIDAGVIRIGNADYLARPLHLSATEASALQVALRALRAGTGAETAAVVDRVIAKLDDAVASAAPPPVEVARSPYDDVRERVASTARELTRAVELDRPVRLVHRSPGRDTDTERVVEPYGVVDNGSHTYLDAWCRSSGDDRLFRLDRVRSVELLDEPLVGPRRAPRDPREAMYGDAAQPGADVVRLSLDAPARWAADYYPVRSSSPRPDGGVDVELVVVDPAWLERLLLRLAPHARVVDHPEFTDSFTARAQHTLRLHREVGRRVGESAEPLTRESWSPR